MAKQTFRFRIVIPNGPITEDTCEALSAGLAIALMEARYPNCKVLFLGRA
jgi:hypothetical protein